MRRTHQLALFASFICGLAPAVALAESGSVLNIHLEPGAAIPLADSTRTPVGQGVSFKVDVPLAYGIALQGNGTGLGFRSGQYLAPGSGIGGGVGVRYRILDDSQGYLLHLGENHEGHRGNLLGNVWVDANLLFLRANGLRTGFDVGAGVEASIVDGLQIGPFAKFVFLGEEKIAMAGLSFSVGIPDNTVHDTDLDKDGLTPPTDKCPDAAEDKDGFEDDDGCPEDDNDKDGIPDVQDQCAQDPEDKDGFEDEDGCPEADNDKDGVVDGADQCVLVPEDRDRFQDEDGCPEEDNDADGLKDADDKCPDQAEDKDGFEDQDGCPDLDNDQDGIADATDKCPDKPETRDGVDDEDGCPEEKAKVYVENQKVVITEKIFFQFNKARILPKSFPLLDSVAQVLQKFPQIRKLRVEGHTDDVGNEAVNQKLSEARAKAVMDYLVKQGMAAERLESVGYGKSRPLVEGKDEAAREKNRRVEFTIVDPPGGVVPVVIDPNAPAEGATGETPNGEPAPSADEAGAGTTQGAESEPAPAPSGDAQTTPPAPTTP